MNILLWIGIAMTVFLLIKYGNRIKIPNWSKPAITSQPSSTHPGTATQLIPSPAPKKSKMGMIGGGIGIIIGILLLVLVASLTYNSVKSLFEEKAKPVIETHEKIYDVPIEIEGIFIYLHPGWQAYPTKKITVVTPTGNIIENTPGEPTYPGYQPEGWYKFSTKEKNCQIKIRDVY